MLLRLVRDKNQTLGLSETYRPIVILIVFLKCLMCLYSRELIVNSPQHQLSLDITRALGIQQIWQGLFFVAFFSFCFYLRVFIDYYHSLSSLIFICF